ncbi:hypothetical protein IFM89_007310 [Coptis chinensis]|uniref:Late embryogenesis abundant protein LEA-2 subgroup domain-containing protein n=1 Tax=Coptis chinensis TaxID=261450 RepID=A0A835LDR5_9MAGN|nr:hypothetical protein IFM89_007310 [Coptis chinensis]
MAEPQGCCSCCTGFIISLGLSALFLWLSLKPSKPTLSIEEFYVPALNKTAANDTKSDIITFTLKLNNKANKDKGVYYDALNVTLYHTQNLSNPVANVTIIPFYQGFKKHTSRKINVTASKAMPWSTALNEVSNGTVFRVDLKTKLRYKIILFKTKRHSIMVGGNITVTDQGSMVKPKKKGVKLSCGSVQVGRFAQVGGLVGFVLIFLWF